MIMPPAGLTPDDYDRIEEAVMETARGRWFLAEFARRVRAGDTQKILQAIERLERASGPAQFAAAQDHARGIGERLMDVAFQLRARAVDEALCRVVEREASAAYALAGEERGPAFAQSFDPPPPEAKRIEARAVAPDAAPAAQAAAPDPAATQGIGLGLDEIERLAPARRIALFS